MDAKTEKELEQRRQDHDKYMRQFLDSIKGSLYGGAVGDALGYPIEFLDEDTIHNEYGPEGICDYQLDPVSGKALISDDTQMALFTANGILVGKSRIQEQGVPAPIYRYVRLSYLDWLKTQSLSYSIVKSMSRGYSNDVISWLCDVEELYSKRAPGNSCISALQIHQALEKHRNRLNEALMNGNDEVLEEYEKTCGLCNEYLERPINDSKGCGGVMRVAPLAMAYDVYNGDRENLLMLDEYAAEVAAITHGHPLGYMTASILVHVVNRLIFGDKSKKLLELIRGAQEAAGKLFGGNEYLSEMNRLIDLAVDLSANQEDDLTNIHRLGEGWVAEEALAIAIYCSLRYPNDFSKAVTVSVNHKGDSDSTGAITGNIVGAIVGYEGIEDKWKQNLELSDVILEMAEDLCYQDPNNAEFILESEWERKYWLK